MEEDELRRSLRREEVVWVVGFGGAAGLCLYPGVVGPFCCWCCGWGNICVGLPPGTGGGGLYAFANEPLVCFTLLMLALGSSPVSRSIWAIEEVDGGARFRARADGLCGTGGPFGFGFGLGFDAVAVAGALGVGWMGDQEDVEMVVLLLGGGGGG